MLLVMNNLENILAQESSLQDKLFMLLDVIHKNIWRKVEWILAYLCQRGSFSSGNQHAFLWILDWKADKNLTYRKKL